MMPLESFCRPECEQDIQAKPFVKGGYRYYVNGHVGVRVPCSEPDSPRSRDLAAVFARPGEPGEPWPSIDYRLLAKSEQCPECGGSGSLECECPDCEKGYHPCDTCRGKGRFVLWKSLQVGPLHVSGGYAWMISLLPVVKYLPAKEGDDKIHFAFEGGEGVLIARTGPSEGDVAHCRIDLAEKWFLKDRKRQEAAR